MRLVEFTRDMAPYTKGDTRAVPDDLAARLVADGNATLRPSVFDAEAPAAAKPSLARRLYPTRKRG